MAVVDDAMSATQTAPPAGERTPGNGHKVLVRTGKVLGAAWRPALVLAAVIAVWWFVAWREMVPAYLVPAPQDVLETLWVDRALLLEHTWVTTQETLIGFVLAAVIGVGTAIVLVYSPTAEKSLYPLIL